MAQAPHVPTDETREKVDALVVAGVLQPDICKVIGVSENTLRKYYSQELETALDKTIANVSATLVQKAMSGDTASCIFFLKVRGKKYGWTERHEITGEEGGPIKTEDVTERDADAFARELASLVAGDGAQGETGEAEPEG